MLKQFFRTCLPLSLSALTLTAACGGDSDDSSPAQDAVVARYAALVYANYSDSLAKADALKTAVNAFVAAPSAQSLEAAKTAWKDSRVPYGQTEAFRFYDGPIDGEDGPEGEINSWPVNEAHIDYVADDPKAGIVNKPDLGAIDKALITKQNQLGGEDNVAAGYHAIEFLLWGQDLSATGPGARPFTDYLTTGGTAMNPDRRGAYLKAAADLLVDDLKTVTDAWEPSKANYAADLIKGGAKPALTKILSGLYRMAALELRGQRIESGYDKREQEQEHSCFSDNTTVDFKMNILGIENVYLGRYGAVDGPGLDEAVRAKDAATDELVKAKLAASKTAIDAIPAPYDQVITANGDTPDRAKVKAAIDALKDLGDAFLKAGTALGLTLDTSPI